VSRTLAHQPAHVWHHQHQLLTAEHHHHHTACDLPTPQQWAQILTRDQPTSHCTYSIKWWRTPPICGCDLCDGGNHTLAGRRRRRHIRQQLRAAAGRSVSTHLDACADEATSSSISIDAYDLDVYDVDDRWW
jgi:hypothetical protein